MRSGLSYPIFMDRKSSISYLAIPVIGGVLVITSLLLSPTISLAAAPDGFGDDSQVKEDAFNIPKAADGKQGEKILNVVKGAVNWTLGILALIALIVLLYGGFLMVTAAGDSGQYEK